MTTGRKLILIISAVLAFAVLAGAVIYSIPQKTSGVYRESFERAELYYSDGDYRMAALEYRKAIQADQNSVDAYEGLSYTYIQMGDLQSARSVASEGYTHTHSERLQTLITHIEEGRYGDFVTKNRTADSDDITPSLDSRLLRRIGGTSYGSYCFRAQPVSSELQADGSVAVVFSEVPGTLIFRNSTAQPKAVNGHNVSGTAIPEEVRLEDIAVSLFGKSPLTRAELQDLGAADIEVRRDSVYGRLLTFSLGGCTFTVACDENDTIQAGAYNLIIPANALQKAGGGGVDRVPMVGSIIDAQTGEPVYGITLRFYEEGASANGEVLEECVTDDSGNYETSLPSGTYTVEVSGDGYVTEEREIQIGETDAEAQEDFVITKELPEGEARIVLEWGSSPTDLDSHLSGETDSGHSFHVSFQNKSTSEGGTVIADLDLDDTTSYGPETTTIHDLNGRYVFAVHNYTPGTGSLEGSDATVSVYLPGQPVQTFHVSDGPIDGNYWYVCVIDHGSLDRGGGSSSASVSEVEESESIDEDATAEDSGLTMEDVGLPYGLYEGYKPQGDGAIDTSLQLNEDMTYRLHCIFPIFDAGEAEDSDGEYTYTGTYRVDRINDSGNAVLFFENSVENFELEYRDNSLRNNIFYVSLPE